MNKNPDGDRVIKDGSGSCISFVRDMTYVKNQLNITIKKALLLLAAIPLIVLITSLISTPDSLTFYIIITELLLTMLMVAVAIAGIYIRNRIIISRICTMFTVYNDRLEIDGNIFETGKITSAFMTPFEYYEKRFITFDYNNKTYRYYFGKFNGIGKSELFYKPYVQLNMLLESRGFSNKY